jgi:hypothetical protein
VTRLSCRRFCANEVGLWLSLMANNLGTCGRRLAPGIGNGWLTGLQPRLKTGGRLVKHARF